MPNATVLVVDDEPLIRWALVNRLNQKGYRTTEAGTANEAIVKVCRESSYTPFTPAPYAGGRPPAGQVASYNSN